MTSPNPPQFSWKSESRRVTTVNREFNLQGKTPHPLAFLRNRRLQTLRSESEINSLGIIHGRLAMLLARGMYVYRRRDLE